MPLLILQFLKKHWRPLAALGLLVVAFIAGRLSVSTEPAQADTHTEYVDRWHESTIAKLVFVQGETRDHVILRNIVTQPDGTIIDHSVEAEHAVTTTQVNAEEKHEASSQTTEKATTHVESPKRPDWRVGALVGVQPRVPLEPLYGALVERRVLGPVSVGAWGVYRGPVGLAVTVEF
jgi:hypothetical protein